MRQRPAKHGCNGLADSPTNSTTKRGSDILADSRASKANQKEKKKIPLLRERLNDHRAMIKSSPSVLLVPLAVWLVLLASGLGVAFSVRATSENSARNEALNLAESTGQYFSDQLDKALVPLFSLAQFVNEINAFWGLPDEIGPSLGEGSLPFVDETHRNVSGVCDDPSTLARFNKIADTIKRNAKMKHVLVNLQLAPQAVVCMIHPLNNTDFEDPNAYLDSTPSIGHDLLHDPARSFIAEATLPGNDVVIAGPLSLRQCRDVDCAPTVQQGLIARLPIASRNHTIPMNGKTYARWGFAVALIDWNQLITRSRVLDYFDTDQKKDFQLTRTDRIPQDDGSILYKTVVLAESDAFTAVVDTQPKVMVALDTTNNQWEMTVTYPPYDLPFVCAVVATSILSVVIACLFYTVLAQKHQLVGRARDTATAERELNDFIAHEVRNPLSAAISACTFVNSAFVGTSKEDTSKIAALMQDSSARQSIGEDLRIIDSSLHFINDLLRSMLDVHRAASKQMQLELSQTDILRDVFEPVASMLYSRDEGFEVVIDCPNHMVVESDRLRLQQVVLNLARNSTKFVTKGFVRLRASVNDENEICIYVEDSGPGIPQEKRAHLFKKFQQSLDSLSQGTGIGLSLCLSLTHLMGGDIYLDESYDSGVEGMPGSRIVINLKQYPKQNPDDTTSRSQPDIEEGAPVPPAETKEDEESVSLPSNLKVLFVDDDRVLRRLAARAIGKVAPGWNVREAASGETAIHLLEETSEDDYPDMIFVDQFMTSVEHSLLGTETVRSLRAKGVQSIMCGLSANDLGDVFQKAGADAFVLKPFPCKESELVPLLAKLLKDHQHPTAPATKPLDFNT